jgi:para-aminobenzoate synthetase/4-amino-4-deoxychorismate lyase
VRLRLRRDGHVSAEVTPLPAAGTAADSCAITISRVPVSSRDPFARHKTTNRAFRDDELRAARESGFGEVLFLNERGELTEGAITNLFVEISGRLFTPPGSCGVLEGIFRRRVLADGALRASERILFPKDLERAERVFLTNSVRGIVPAFLPAACPASTSTATR